jgi:uncharacterized RDD family membrane protein YckC
MNCPRCGLINPAESARCDCGYDFQTGAVHRVAAPNNGFALASLGERFAGQFLDSLVAYGGIFLGMHITQKVGFGSAVPFLLFVFYLLFADGLGNGQSLGKKLIGTAVVDEQTGAPCSYWKSFVRNVVMFFGVFDWAFIFGDRRQRLGDKAASTVVIKLRPGIRR